MGKAPSNLHKTSVALEESFARGEGDWGFGLSLRRRTFHSERGPLLEESASRGPGSAPSELDCDDVVPQNRDFPLWWVAPRGSAPHRAAVVLLHGLNERRWAKYLPWAHSLCSELGRPVVLFPIAFHMQRSPERWSDPRQMWRVSKARQLAIPELVESSFVNAALSFRLHARPERLLWSGHRTLLDLIHWVEQVDEGLEPLLTPGARIDFFGYSIGAFLAEILLMGDALGRFQQSRAFSFCGGCLLAQSAPVSREILDSAAARAIQRLFVEEWSQNKELRPALARFLSDDPLGRAFDLMIREDRHRQQRASQLKRIGERISALALERDWVIPACAVKQTLAGTGAAFARLDFPFPYDHAHPFPLHAGAGPEVDLGFEMVFSRAVRWLEVP